MTPTPVKEVPVHPVCGAARGSVYLVWDHPACYLRLKPHQAQALASQLLAQAETEERLREIRREQRELEQAVAPKKAILAASRKREREAQQTSSDCRTDLVCAAERLGVLLLGRDYR